jgi:hypothetical protein
MEVYKKTTSEESRFSLTHYCRLYLGRGDKNTALLKAIFGDHLMIKLNLDLNKPVITPTIRRNWRNCSKELLFTMLESKDWSAKPDSVQGWCEIIENNKIQVLDKIVQLTTFVNNQLLNER